MSTPKERHTGDEQNERAEKAFSDIVTHLGSTVFDELCVMATMQTFTRPDRATEGVSLTLQPDELGTGIPGMQLDVRPDSIDFSFGAEGPFHLAMEQAIALLPPETKQ